MHLLHSDGQGVCGSSAACASAIVSLLPRISGWVLFALFAMCKHPRSQLLGLHWLFYFYQPLALPQEEKEGFCNDVRPVVKAAGILDTTENCWDFFIEQVPLD